MSSLDQRRRNIRRSQRLGRDFWQELGPDEETQSFLWQILCLVALTCLLALLTWAGVTGLLSAL